MPSEPNVRAESPPNVSPDDVHALISDDRIRLQAVVEVLDTHRVFRRNPITREQLCRAAGCSETAFGAALSGSAPARDFYDPVRTLFVKELAARDAPQYLRFNTVFIWLMGQLNRYGVNNQAVCRHLKKRKAELKQVRGEHYTLGHSAGHVSHMRKGEQKATDETTEEVARLLVGHLRQLNQDASWLTRPHDPGAPVPTGRGQLAGVPGVYLGSAQHRAEAVNPAKSAAVVAAINSRAVAILTGTEPPSAGPDEQIGLASTARFGDGLIVTMIHGTRHGADEASEVGRLKTEAHEYRLLSSHFLRLATEAELKARKKTPKRRRPPTSV